MKTKAAVLREIGKLEVEDVEIPPLSAGQVLVKFSYSGICGSQLNEVYGLKGPDRYLPHLLGHEGSGIVEEVAEGVTKVKEGDYVVATWIKGSGADVPSTKYRSGNQEINSGAIATFSERAVISENRLVPLANTSMNADISALLGCAVPTGAGMIYHVVGREPARTKTNIAIFGVGGIGSSALLAAAEQEYQRIIAIDVSNEKLQHAVELGATDYANARTQNVLEKIRDITKGGVNYAVEASGKVESMRLAFESLAPKGMVVIAGNAPRGETFSIDPSQLNQGKRIFGTWGGEANPDIDIPFYEGKYSEGRLPFDKLITKNYHLEQINEALEELRMGNLCRGLLDLK